jgi:lipoprotein-anchoring transpeptidase ErfK/SrfK
MPRIEVSLSTQRLRVFEACEELASFAVSTAKNGAGQQKGSECTPLGKHIIADKIGEGEPLNTVFVGRKATGEIYTPELSQEHPERDWILTRILWLKGCEEGVNLGGEVDSYQRYIYIHASPASRPMGEPQSHGCVTLQSNDMLQLFSLVSTQTPVEIIA